MGKLFLNKKKIQLSNQQDNSIQESIVISESKNEEIKEKRQENIKHFKQKDGTIIAQIYNDAVNYYQPNQHRYREIDNRFKENETQTEYLNAYNAFHVHVPKNAKDKIYEIEKEDTKITFLFEQNKNLMPKQELQDQINHSKMVYEDAYPQADLELHLIGNRIKSNVILKNKEASFQYTFRLHLTNLTAQLSASQQEVEFYSTKNQQLQLILKAPMMFDANQNYSEDICYEIKQESEQEYLLLLKANSEWIQDVCRVFPITLDPEIILPNNTQKITTYYSEGEDLKDGTDTFFVGMYKPTSEEPVACKGYIYFNLPSLPKNAILKDIRLHLIAWDVPANFDYAIHPITSGVPANGLPTHSEEVIDEGIFPSNGILEVNLSHLYHRKDVKGVVLKKKNEINDITNRFYIRGSSATSYYPAIIMQYVESPKEVSSKNTKTYALNDKASLLIHLSKGKKYFQFDDLTLSSLTFSHQYSDHLFNQEYEVDENQNPLTPSFHLGKGFKSNFTRFLYHQDRKNQTAEGHSIIYFEDFDNRSIFEKKYFYVLEEQQHFIEESEVLKDANHQLYYVDNDKKRHEVTKAYVDRKKRMLITNDEKAKLIDQLGLQRNVSRYYFNHDDEKVVIEFNDDDTFLYKVAQLEGGYHVDYAFIQEINGEQYYSQNYIEKKVIQPIFIKARLIQRNGEEYFNSNSLVLNNYTGEIEAKSYRIPVYKEYNDDDTPLPFDQLMEQTYYLDQAIQNGYDNLENLKAELAKYEGYNQQTKEQLEEEYLALQKESMLYDFEQNEYLLKQQEEALFEEISKNKVWDKIVDQDFKQKIEEIKNSPKDKQKELLNDFFKDEEGNAIRYIVYSSDEYKAHQDLKTQYDLVIKQQKSLQNQKRMQYLQGKILQVQIEKAKPFDYLTKGDSIYGFDYHGKLVEINSKDESYFMHYDEQDYLISITNQDEKTLMEFDYENGYLLQAKDYQGRTTKYTYNNNHCLTKMEQSSGFYLTFQYNDYGLCKISDAYQKHLSVTQNNELFTVQKSSTAKTIKNDDVIEQEEQILEKETIDTSYYGMTEIQKDQLKRIFMFDDFGNPYCTYIQKEDYPTITQAMYQFEGENLKYQVSIHESQTNYLGNGEFDQGLTLWNKVGDGSLVYQSGEQNKNVLKLIGHPLYQHQISQTIPGSAISSLKGVVFSGWAKALSTYVTMTQKTMESDEELDENTTARFELRIEVTYADQTKQIARTTFNWNNPNWQLCCVPLLFESDKQIQSLNVIADYSYNLGEVLLDHFLLTEAKGTLTQYHENQTIQYETDFQSKTIYEKYDKKKPIQIKTIDSSGYETTSYYTYDTQDRLIYVEDDKGMVTAYDYDDETQEVTTLSYHRLDPTSKFYSYSKYDKESLTLQVKDKKENDQFLCVYTFSDEIDPLVLSSQCGKQQIFYGYDKNTNLLVAKSQVIQNQEATLYYHYTNNLLTQVKNNDEFEIQYEYDNQDNITKIAFNQQEMVNYDHQYAVNVSNYVDNQVKTEKGFIHTIMDPHGYQIQKHYNRLNHITQICKKETDETTYQTICTYHYNKKNQLVKIKDEVNQQEITYTYLKDDLLSASQKGDVLTQYQYDNDDNLLTLKQTIDDQTWTYQYTYDPQIAHQCIKITLPNSIAITDKKDLLQRLKEKQYTYAPSFSLLERYDYHKIQDQASNAISRVQTFILDKLMDDTHYTYDANGNISSILQNGKSIAQYQYDEANQLIEERQDHFKIHYTYDSQGNLLTKIKTNLLTNEETEVHHYTYSLSTFGKQLTDFDNQNLTYDDYGLLLQWNQQSLTYNYQHQMTQFGTHTFQYDAFGCRTFKNQIEYTYDDQGRLLKEVNGTHTILYFYDGLSICSIQVDGQSYFLRRNLFQDVTHIYDLNGNLVASYLYDAWGNHQVFDANGIENTNADFIGNINPIRYRGYYFDVETNLFYCNSRYYSSELCRFLIPDSIEYLDPESIHGLNLYCYCKNNPIMLVDPSGNFPILALVLGITALAGLGLTIGGVASDNNTLTAIGLGMVGIVAIVSGGIAFAGAIATGATLTGIIGGVTATAGLGSLGFMSAEIQEATGNGNWIMDITGMSDGLYNTLLLSTATIATLGTVASSISNAFNIKSINGFGKYGDYYGMRFQTGAGKTRVLSFHNHGHKVAKGIKSIGEWHCQLKKWDSLSKKTTGTIARWIWWRLTRM